MAAAIGESRIEIELRNYRMRSNEIFDFVNYTPLKFKERNVFCVSFLNDRTEQLDG